MECFGSIYVRCGAIAQCDRIAFFLRSETRPLFPEDVPEHEENLVEAFEDAETPTSLQSDGTTLAAYFDQFEGFDTAEATVKAIAAMQPSDIYLFFANDEETRHYYRYAQGELRFLLSELPLDGEDDVRLNRNVPGPVKAKIEKFEDPADGLRRPVIRG